MTITQEQILALAGEPATTTGPANLTYSNKLKINDPLYTADQLIAARKPLEEEVEELSVRLEECAIAIKEDDELRQQLAAAQQEIADQQAAFLAQVAKSHDETAKLKALAKKMADALQETSSKLESQVSRNADLPPYYKEVVSQGFEALSAYRELIEE